jgi:3-oxoacyl-[acyl-carrier-protein] synthase II
MRVAITGLGATTPVGETMDQTWTGLIEGRSGVTRIDAPWAEGLPVSIAGRVPETYQERLTVTQRRRMDRFEQFAALAGGEAWRDSNCTDADPDRVAVVIGSAIGGLGTTLEQQQRLATGGPRRVSPHTVTMMMANGAAAWLSIEIGARAGARTPVSACASSSEAIMMGRQMILAGDADVVLAGGTEACVTDLTLAALAQTRALSRRNDDPAGASRPFDVDRDGFVLGEGAAALVLENEEHARARGAHIYAYVEGAALTSDAHDIVAADSDNQERTMRLALRSAGLSGADMGFVHAHATATRLGDVNESRAIRAAVGPTAVTSSKSMVGHLLGAAGALGTVLTARALSVGMLPGTINIAQVDPEIDLDVVTSPRAGNWGAGMVNAFGFGGHNVTLVLTRP